jgi:GTP-binding protein
VETEILDLFLTLEASEEQLDYPIVYASAKEGWAVTEWPMDASKRQPTMSPLFDLIIKHVPPPQADPGSPFSMLVTQLESDAYVGKCYLGRVSSGTVRVGDQLKALDELGKQTDAGRVIKLFQRNGLDRVTVDEAGAGDIVTIAGFSNASVNSTLCHPAINEPIKVR